MLFDKQLDGGDGGARCGDCKILTERFTRMPELDEG
jgi:hypothetical protein